MSPNRYLDDGAGAGSPSPRAPFRSVVSTPARACCRFAGFVAQQTGRSFLENEDIHSGAFDTMFTGPLVG